MKFEVKMLPQAQKEYNALTQEQKKAIDKDYDTIKNAGLEFVKKRFIKDGIFEIKTNEVRSLFKYQKKEIILVGLIYVKKTQKLPKQFLELVQKRLNNV